MTTSQKRYICLAAAYGGLAVIFGAFAAHGLRARLTSNGLATFEVGVRYQMYHALAMLAVSAISALWAGPWASRACMTWAVGIAAFSGSLYLLALTGVRWFGVITPLGGIAMIAGWVLVLVAAGTTDVAKT